MAAALLAELGIVVVLWATATVEFTWRYVLPSLALLPRAAVMAAGSGIMSGVARQPRKVLMALRLLGGVDRSGAVKVAVKPSSREHVEKQ
jgi:hypothetical protein